MFFFKDVIYGCQPKNRGGKLPPKMDGENNGKPYEQMDDLGGFPLFLETPIYTWNLKHSFVMNGRFSWMYWIYWIFYCIHSHPVTVQGPIGEVPACKQSKTYRGGVGEVWGRT